jgi:hypothetical protein
MRFRLATTGQGQDQLTGGVGRAFQTLAMLPMLKAQAGEEAARARAEMDTRAAQQRQADAHAALYGAQADEKRQTIESRSLPERIAAAARMNRVSPEQLPEVQQYFQTGQLDSRYVTPANGVGPVLPRPEYADMSGVGGRIMQQLGLLDAGYATDSKINQIAQAGGELQKQEAVRDLVANPGNAGRTGQAFAAVEGKPLIQNIGNTGRGFNQFTGDGGVLEQGIATLFDQGERAEIGQRNAAAASSYASAGAARALERQRNEETSRGAKSGDIKEVIGPDGSVYLVNKLTGDTRQVVGNDGKPLVSGKAGGAGTGAGKPMTEGQAKANLFGGRMVESARTLKEMEDKGVYRPGNIKSLATGAASAIPLIGNALAEGASAATNWTQSSDQQRVEQARRDFVNAVLRRESGAVISDAEFSNAEKQYFPAPGDSKETREQKRRNREIAINLMLQEVPEAHRYRPQAATAPVAPAPVAPEGSWGAPGGWKIERVN